MMGGVFNSGKDSGGYTIIKIILVIIFIWLLAVPGKALYEDIYARFQANQAQQRHREIVSAVEMFVRLNGGLPCTSCDLDGYLPGGWVAIANQPLPQSHFFEFREETREVIISTCFQKIREGEEPLISTVSR